MQGSSSAIASRIKWEVNVTHVVIANLQPRMHSSRRSSIICDPVPVSDTLMIECDWGVTEYQIGICIHWIHKKSSYVDVKREMQLAEDEEFLYAYSFIVARHRWWYRMWSIGHSRGDVNAARGLYADQGCWSISWQALSSLGDNWIWKLTSWINIRLREKCSWLYHVALFSHSLLYVFAWIESDS